MVRMPRSGDLYRHFKDNLYQIVAIANHSETGERLVIYQALYGDYQVYARPLAMFISEVDHEKYPDVTQKYRFEYVERGMLRRLSAEAQASCERASREEQTLPESSVQVSLGVEHTTAVTGSEWTKQAQSTGQRPQTEAVADDVNPKLLEFLDADDLEEKYTILLSMRNEVDDQLINNMAVTMDVVIPDGDVQERYEQLKNCIKTKQYYEKERIR